MLLILFIGGLAWLWYDTNSIAKGKYRKEPVKEPVPVEEEKIIINQERYDSNYYEEKRKLTELEKFHLYDSIRSLNIQNLVNESRGNMEALELIRKHLDSASTGECLDGGKCTDFSCPYMNQGCYPSFNIEEDIKKDKWRMESEFWLSTVEKLLRGEGKQTPGMVSQKKEESYYENWDFSDFEQEYSYQEPKKSGYWDGTETDSEDFDDWYESSNRY